MKVEDRIDVSSWNVQFPQRAKRHKYSKGCGMCAGFAVGSSAATCKEVPTWWLNNEPTPLTFGGQKDLAVRDARGNEMVGFWSASGGSKIGAVLWRANQDGTAGYEEVELHSADFSKTYAMGVGGNAQVGFGTPKVKKGERSRDRALLWRGSNVVVVLATPEELESTAFGTDGEFQVGSINNLAALWRGSEAPPVMLGGGASFSQACGVRDGEQVGQVWNGVCSRAALWKGSPESQVDLTPNGFEAASALDCAAGFQVGFVKKKDLTPSGSSSMDSRAVIWAGSNVCFDLQDLLPAPWNSSIASRIEISGDDVIVVGEAVNVVTTGPGLHASQAMAESSIVIWRGKLK